uniref:Uncharacterized protein n=1 Tax=Panagrolaimus superbus TaxID=310955 RepID=A0A914Z5W9_9BILA
MVENAADSDDIDPVYGQLCESRYGDDVGPARGELYGYGDPMDVRIYMVDVELGVARGYHESQAGLASNDDGITHERQGNPASNDVFPRGFGNVSESQAVPASSYTVESLENAVQLQNRQMVESATLE